MSGPPSERTRVRRLPKRAVYDPSAIHAILDEAFFCHLAYVADGMPVVIPTIHARAGERLLVHGSAASRTLRALRQGAPVCVSVTLLDGLVLARSAFHHSMNYRSVVVFGEAREITEREEKLEAMRVIVEHVAPGRWDEVRWPNEKELEATSVLALPLGEASAKIRTGPPIDDEEDYALAVWAGELPLRLGALAPVPDPRLELGAAMSPSIIARRERFLDGSDPFA